jgi:hypothetical protein
MANEVRSDDRPDVAKHVRVVDQFLGGNRQVRMEMVTRRGDGYGLDATAMEAVNARLTANLGNVLEAGTATVTAPVRRSLEFFGVAIPEAPGTGGEGTPTIQRPGGVDPAAAPKPTGGRRGRR